MTDEQRIEKYKEFESKITPYRFDTMLDNEYSITDHSRRVLRYIHQQLKRVLLRGGVFVPLSQIHMASELNIDITAIKKATVQLQESGYIEAKRQKINLYTVRYEKFLKKMALIEKSR